MRGATALPNACPPSMRYFNPRSPCGERPFIPELELVTELISIHAPRAGSDNTALERILNHLISIHAPRAGSDARPTENTAPYFISIHAPRAGSDGWHSRVGRLIYKFQSTLPVRGATAGSASTTTIASNFNPRSPCGERRHNIKML